MSYIYTRLSPNSEQISLWSTYLMGFNIYPFNSSTFFKVFRMNLRLWAVFLEMRDLDILLRQVHRDNTL